MGRRRRRRRRAGAFLSGTGRPGERARRSAPLFLPPSPPFSPCPRAGIAPRPRRWSARTAGPSGQRAGGRGRASQGREWWAGEAGPGGAWLPSGIVGKAPSRRALAPAAAGGPAGARTRPRWRAIRGLRLGPAPSASSGAGAGLAMLVRGLPGSETCEPSPERSRIRPPSFRRSP